VNVGICGNGYLGKSLFREFLKNESLNVIMLPDVFKRPTGSVNDLGLMLRDLGINIFVNASGSTDISRSMSYPNEFKREQLSQVEQHMSAVESLRKEIHYVYLSSGSVYGSDEITASKESDPLKPKSPYAEGKIMVEKLLRKKSIELNGVLKVTNLRVFSPYSNEMQNRIFGSILSQLRETQRLKLSGTGNEIRDFIHLKDFARISVALIEKRDEESYCDVNIGTGKPFTVNALVSLANKAYLEHFGSNFDVTYSDNHHLGNPKYMLADTYNMKVMSQSEPKIDQHNGIYDYFMKNFNA